MTYEWTITFKNGAGVRVFSEAAFDFSQFTREPRTIAIRDTKDGAHLFNWAEVRHVEVHPVKEAE